MKKNIKGTVIILGFNGVIGMACTSRLLEEGYNILGTHSGNRLLDKNLIEDISKKCNGDLTTIKLDVTKTTDINNFKIYLRENLS